MKSICIYKSIWIKKQISIVNKKRSKKENIVRQISSCLTDKYNGFQAISIEFARRERKNFKPIDIIYKPTKNPEISPLCYYTEDISRAYTNFYNVEHKNKRAYSCYECYYCKNFFFKKDTHKRHIENCTGVPGVVYNFNTKSLISLQDKFHVKVDLPFVLYFAFETTAPTDICFDPEQKKMFVVYNVLIVAFHPALNIKRIITQKSYAHSLEQLTSLN